jgi:hypothetical protein
MYKAVPDSGNSFLILCTVVEQMSIKERVNQADVRPVIDSLFPKPDVRLDGEIVQPAQTENYAEIGAAFNYLFSFWLAGHNDQTEIVRWPTSAGLERIETTYPSYNEAAQQRVDAAEQALARYTTSGELSDALCLGALDLARVEAAYNGDRPRALQLLRRLGTAEEADVSDLRGLYRAIPERFDSLDAVVVNPEFGALEYRVGDVDADVVCDGSLLDLKTTKTLRLKIGYWRKLVGYATLAEAARSVSDPLETPFSETTIPAVDSVGVYFSRHGCLWRTSTARIYDHEQYPEFKDWFIEQVAG